jgi:hypothetical protein
MGGPEGPPCLCMVLHPPHGDQYDLVYQAYGEGAGGDNSALLNLGHVHPDIRILGLEVWGQGQYSGREAVASQGRVAVVPLAATHVAFPVVRIHQEQDVAAEGAPGGE